MQGDESIPRIPWSRHLVVTPKTKLGSTSKGNKVDNYKNRQTAWESRRKTLNESNSGNNGDHINYGSSTCKRKKLREPVQGKTTGKNVIRRKSSSGGDVAKRNTDFVVEFPEEVVPDRGYGFGNQTPLYTHNYLNLMYYACMTPYKWDNTQEDDQSRCQYALVIIQKILCYYIVFLASFTSFTMIKYEVVNFVEDRTLNQFIEIGYFVASGTVHWYFTYVIWFRYDKISNTFKSWEIFDKTTNAAENSAETKRNQEWLPKLNASITLFMAIMKAVMYTDLGNWSIDGIILHKSMLVSYGVFIWTPEHLRDGTILEQYGTQPNATTYAMGIFGIISYTCWNLQIDCFKDMLTWVAITNKQHMQNFGHSIRERLSKKKQVEKNTAENEDRSWKAYRETLAVNDSTNDCYNYMLIINHLDSILVSSYCLTEILNKDVSLRSLVFLGYNVIKALLPYLSARIAAKENEPCRKWIQSLPCQTERFLVGNTPYTRDVMLVELDKEPLGLGRGKVHINNEFLVSMITFIASLFCFLLNIKPKEEIERLVY